MLYFLSLSENNWLRQNKLQEQSAELEHEVERLKRYNQILENRLEYLRKKDPDALVDAGIVSNNSEIIELHLPVIVENNKKSLLQSSEFWLFALLALLFAASIFGFIVSGKTSKNN